MTEGDQNPAAKPEALSRRQLLLGRKQADPSATVVAQVGSSCLMAQGVACRLCEDSCDTAAFRFRPLIGGRTEVSVDETRCTACGACVGRCPVGAIAVSGTSRRAESQGADHG